MKKSFCEIKDFKFYPGTFDTHAHLWLLEKELGCSDLSDLYDSFVRLGLWACLDVGLYLDDLEERLQKGSSYQGLYFSVGHHPLSSPQRYASPRGRSISSSRVVAIGELGLDYVRSPQTASWQKEILYEQMLWAQDLRKPVILHNREAHDDLLEIAQELALEKAGIVHCFSGGPWEWIRSMLDLGYYFSLAGNLSYPKNQDLRDLVKKIPLDRLLVETDTPYLAPQTHRGRLNCPALIYHTIECLAEIYQQSPEEMTMICSKNACTLFDLNEKIRSLDSYQLSRISSAGAER